MRFWVQGQVLRLSKTKGGTLLSPLEHYCCVQVLKGTWAGSVQQPRWQGMDLRRGRSTEMVTRVPNLFIKTASS